MNVHNKYMEICAVTSSTTITKSSLIDTILERNICNLILRLEQCPKLVDGWFENSGGDQLDACRCSSITPLLAAVKLDSVSMVSVIVNDFHANVNVSASHDGRTPLHLACARNCIAVASILLNSKNIDISLSDKVVLVDTCGVS